MIIEEKKEIKKREFVIVQQLAVVRDTQRARARARDGEIDSEGPFNSYFITWMGSNRGNARRVPGLHVRLERDEKRQRRKQKAMRDIEMLRRKGGGGRRERDEWKKRGKNKEKGL
jgi:hypothetical protein